MCSGRPSWPGVKAGHCLLFLPEGSSAPAPEDLFTASRTPLTQSAFPGLLQRWARPQGLKLGRAGKAGATAASWDREQQGQGACCRDEHRGLGGPAPPARSPLEGAAGSQLPVTTRCLLMMTPHYRRQTRRCRLPALANHRSPTRPPSSRGSLWKVSADMTEHRVLYPPALRMGPQLCTLESPRGYPH